jgi:hypothetical protein
MLTLPTRKLAASRPYGAHRAGSHPYGASMHGKDKAIAPAFRRHLGIPVLACDFIDTDVFGTFTGEVPRRGTMLDAATEKAKTACARTGRRLGIGSEGSFGPHPSYPFVGCNTEIIVLYDRELDIRIIEGVASMRTNFRHLDVDSPDQVESFLASVGAPSHAVVVGSAGQWGRGPLFKGLTTVAGVQIAFDQVKRAIPHERVRIATDMRAHLNPTRMAVIRAAASRLARRIATLCPACGTPGFGVVETKAGLPCSVCEMPTNLPVTALCGCQRCAFRHALSVSTKTHADPGQCLECNP